MDNLSIYGAVCNVPQEALKPIQGGKLKGKSDINPMWRIKTLTEQFGPCGVGWGYIINRLWTEPGAGGEVAAFADISMWYMLDGKRSELIPGIGGSMLICSEKGNLVTSDECYKMALTDAISVAAKALGVAGNVYWEKDPTKYNGNESSKPTEPVCCQCCGAMIQGVTANNGQYLPAEALAARSHKKYGKTLCVKCARQIDEATGK